jgi:hypothetical protein
MTQLHDCNPMGGDSPPSFPFFAGKDSQGLSGGSTGSNSSASPGTTVAVTYSDPGIETFPHEGQIHAPAGTQIEYHTYPPTSDNHYPDPEPGGFFEAPIAPGFLIHSMEHGGVIIY